MHKEVIQNAGSIAIHVIKIKDWTGDYIYKIDKDQLNKNLQCTLREVKELINQNVTSEMRHTDTDNAVQCCKNVVVFSKNVLDANILDKVKIVLFSDMNIIGYMFDRNEKSYIACNELLNQLLDCIEKYKSSLPSSELHIWNNSTYARE